MNGVRFRAVIYGLSTWGMVALGLAMAVLNTDSNHCDDDQAAG